MTAAYTATTSRRYTIAICKGAGMVTETRRLLAAWRPGEPVDGFVRRAMDEHILGQGTAYRTRDVIRRVFARRYLVPTDRPARMLKAIAGSALPPRVFTEMLLVYACRADDLLYDFVRAVYWPAARAGRTRLRMSEVLAFLSDAEAQRLIPEPWSEEVRKKIARGLLGMLRDVGFVRELGRGNQEREIVPYQLSDAGAGCLAWDLRVQGVTDLALCEHPDWGLFGMSRERVVERLERLGERRGLIVQRAGSVVSLTWRVRSLEDLIDVLAR